MEYNVSEHILPFLHHVGFTVSDLDASVDFYCNKLGFKLFNRWTEPMQGEATGVGMGVPGASIELAQLVGYGCMLEFIQYLDHVGSKQRIAPNHAGLGHVAFLVDDLDAFKAHLESEGVEFCSEPIVLDTSKWVHFYDCDHIRVEVMQFSKPLLDQYLELMNIEL